MEVNQILIEKAKQCKSAEEIIAIAKENDLEITVEEAEAYFNQFNQPTGEISDDELDDVSGGGCETKDGRKVVNSFTTCGWWRCEIHGCEKENTSKITAKCSNPGCNKSADCRNCKHSTREKGRLICNFEE